MKRVRKDDPEPIKKQTKLNQEKKTVFYLIGTVMFDFEPPTWLLFDSRSTDCSKAIIDKLLLVLKNVESTKQRTAYEASTTLFNGLWELANEQSGGIDFKVSYDDALSVHETFLLKREQMGRWKIVEFDEKFLMLPLSTAVIMWPYAF